MENNQSAVLQIGCDKGFLLHDFQQVQPGIKIRGTEISDYAIENSMDSVKPYIQKSLLRNSLLKMENLIWYLRLALFIR